MHDAHEARTDAELVAAHLRGDRTAFEALLRRHLDATYGFVSRMVRDGADADDVTQEAFVKAWKHLRRYDPSRSFRTWVFGIAKNTALDFLRRSKKVMSFTAYENGDPERGEDAPGIAGAIPDTSPIASELLLAAESVAESAESARTMLAALPPEQRRVIELHHGQDLTFREIGELLGLGLDTVKSRYRRAILSLKKTYAGA